MGDPIILRILGMLLVAGGAAAIAFAPVTLYPAWLMIGGGIGAALGTVLVVFSAFFRRHHEGLSVVGERRVGKPSAIRRVGLFWGGLFLVIISPLVGAIPGPGGVFVFAAGFGMMLKGSRRVKKWFARFKRRHPAKGAWADFGLRRASYRRRQALLKAQALAGDSPELPTDRPRLDKGLGN